MGARTKFIEFLRALIPLFSYSASKPLSATSGDEPREEKLPIEATILFLSFFPKRLTMGFRAGTGGRVCLGSVI